MDKLKMAHEYVMNYLSNPSCENATVSSVVSVAWAYADAMQAEADERNRAEAEQKRKAVREMLNADNTFLEKEGQHFDDVCSDEIHAQRDAELYGCGFLKVTYNENGVKYERLNPMTVSLCAKNIGLDSDVLKEWQPDWSQAPSSADYWAMDKSGLCNWYENKPEIYDDQWDFGDAIEVAPQFTYTGTWQDSLRKRPTNI